MNSSTIKKITDHKVASAKKAGKKAESLKVCVKGVFEDYKDDTRFNDDNSLSILLCSKCILNECKSIYKFATCNIYSNNVFYILILFLNSIFCNYTSN